MSNNGKPLLVFFGHHKCATTWISSIIRRVCIDLNLAFETVSGPRWFDGNLEAFVKKHQIEFLSYTNAEMGFVNPIKNLLGFHVIRDPRDILVSAYFSHLYSHTTDNWPELVEHRQVLQKVSQEEGLMLEMEFIADVFAAMRDWDYHQPNVLEIKMEELMANPCETMLAALRHLTLVDDDTADPKLFYLMASAMNRLSQRNKGLMTLWASPDKIPAGVLQKYIQENSFSKMAEGRKPGEENVKSHYRKGIAGDWMNHLTANNRRQFGYKYGDLLLKLKYEMSPSWAA